MKYLGLGIVIAGALLVYLTKWLFVKVKRREPEIKEQFRLKAIGLLISIVGVVLVFVTK